METAKQVPRRLEGMRAMVAEAAADAPLDPSASQNQNIALLLLAMFAVTGTMHWPRGWVQAAQEEFLRAGCCVPTREILRWFRSRVQDDPGYFAGTPGADPELIRDLADRCYEASESETPPPVQAGARTVKRPTQRRRP